MSNTTATTPDNPTIEALDALGTLWGNHATHLETLAAQARQQQRECRLQALVLAAPPQERWELVNVGDLRLGDVIEWLNWHGPHETVAHLGNAGRSDNGQPQIEIGTDLMGNDIMLDAYTPVRVRLPRAADTTDVDMIDAARNETQAS